MAIEQTRVTGCGWWTAAGCAALAVACGSAEGGAAPGEVTPDDLANRAYVISEGSNDLFVVDLATMSEVGRVDTSAGSGVNANHMSMLSADGRKLYITAAEQDALVVVDTTTLEVVRRVELGAHPTHAESCLGCGPDGHDELWIVNEGGAHADEGESEPSTGSIAVLDMQTDEVIRTLSDPSLVVPHFVRFSGRTAYVPSIGGNQITVFDLATRRVSDVLLRPGVTP